MNSTSPQRPFKVKVFLALLWLVAVGCLALAVTHWDSPDLIKFGAFLALALVSIGVKLPSPVSGDLPITFLFVLLGAFELTPSETIVLASTTTLVQCLWRRTSKIVWDQVFFQVAVMAIASAAVTAVHNSPIPVMQLAGLAKGHNVEPAARLITDTASMFLLNTIPLIWAVSMSEEVPFFSTWWTVSSWSLPYYLGGGLIALFASFIARILGWPTLLLAGPVVYLIFRSYRLHTARIENEKKHAADVSSLQLRTIEALALAIEAKDDTTHEHLARVQVYARELAIELGLTEEEQEALRAASILHDIGKLAVPEHIISKPGRLTPEEFEKMKIHPIVGAEILERVEFPYPVAPIVRAHHEKWDGSGYPYGIKGDAIPIGARILAAVDCLDALATDRQYRRALPLDEAMKIVQKDSGTAFDPRVVDVLARRYVELEKMAKAHVPEAMKLSKDIKIERGAAPAAGFESAAPNSASLASLSNALASAPGHAQPPTDFLTQIASARQEVQALFEISQELGSSLSLDETLSLLDMKLKRLIPYHSIAVWIRQKDTLVPRFVAGDEHRLFSALQIPIGQGLSGWVAENRKPILNGNPAVEAGYLKGAAPTSNLRSAIAVPLEGVEDIVGVLTLYDAGRDAFTRDHLRILSAVSSKIALSVENALRCQTLNPASPNDALTGLINSRTLFLQFETELARSRHTNSPVAILMMDLDNFKSVNERFGENEGDRILCSIANRLRQHCREYDLVARMGGDEFALVLPTAHAGELEGKIEQIRAAIAHSAMEVLGGETLNASIGAAYAPKDGSDAAALLSEAERNMYAEKALHKKRDGKFRSPQAFPASNDQSYLTTVH